MRQRVSAYRNSSRFSAGTRSWERAERLKREIEDALDPRNAELLKMKAEQQAARVCLTDAVSLYLCDLTTRNLAPATIRKRKGIFQHHLLLWANKNSLVYLDELTTSKLSQWRATWTLAPLSKR